MSNTKASSDPFRPQHEPHRTIYDAFVAEARKRPGRALEIWIQAELDSVYQAALGSFPKSGLPTPTREQVAAAEHYARGSADYGLTWACTLVNDMRRAAQHGARV